MLDSLLSYKCLMFSHTLFLTNLSSKSEALSAESADQRESCSELRVALVKKKLSTIFTGQKVRFFLHGFYVFDF